MKNKFFGFFSKLLVVVAGCLMFASFSPSLDGRAVVVDEGVFPEGLFAKTVGYLPGDTISVTNISRNKTIDILVIGALDASEGVAIMLTPEAANELGIESASNCIVKITKRSGIDDRVFGTAVIATQNVELSDEDLEAFTTEDETETKVDETIAVNNDEEAYDEDFSVNPEEPVEESTEEDFSETFAEPEESLEEDFEDDYTEELDVPETFETITAVEVEEDPEETVESEEYFPDDEFYEESAEEVEEDFETEEELMEDTAESESVEEETFLEPEVFDEEFVEEEYVEETETADDVDVPVEEEAFAEESFEDEEFVEETEKVLEDENEEEIAEEIAEEETESEDESVIPEEEVEEELLEEAYIPDDEFYEEPVVEEIEEVLVEDDTEDEIIEEEVLVEEPVEEILPEETEAVEEEIVEEEVPAEEDVETESETDEDEYIDDEDWDDDEYEPIILVPVVNESVVESRVAAPVETKVEEEIVNTVETAPVVEAVVETKVEAPVETKVENKIETPVLSYQNYMVEKLSDLDSTKYYIQIAALGKDANIQEIVNKYGKNYPLTIVPKAGSNIKLIFVGPLTMDEYKVVLERFKSYGFKDAFIKKLK